MNKEEIREQIKNSTEGETIETVIDNFGKKISYNQIMDVISVFSSKGQEKIKEGIHRKQQEFWDHPNQVEYYKEIHRFVPLVPDHYRRIAGKIDPRDGEVIVDLCCGTGNLMKEIIDIPSEFKLIGIDYSQNSLNEIKKDLSGKKNLDLICYDSKEGIPLENNTADKIISSWGISYLEKEELEKTLQEINNVLKPEGIFIFASLVKGGQKIHYKHPSLFLKLLRAVFQKPTHTFKALIFEKRCKMYFKEYGVEELEEMLEESCFEILEKSFTIGSKEKGKSVLFITRKK